MKIGNIDLKNGIMLAPMAGFSDRAMRFVCHKYGADYSVTEMISAKAVTFLDKKTFALAKISRDEGPVGLQLFGSEPDIMARATEIISKGYEGENFVPPVAIDINMGCPVHKVFSNGEGSALMKNPELIYKIVKATKENCDLPITVKMRSGIDEDHINAVECAIAVEEGGASLVCVHGRTRVQMYGGSADREIIRKVKNAVKIPVVANGDIVDGESAIAMLKETGADGLAIGRGAVGNPFIFDEIQCALDGKLYTPPTIEEKINVALLQLKLAVEDKGERIAIPEARKQIALYLKGIRGASRMRGEINLATSYNEVENIFKSFIETNFEN